MCGDIYKEKSLFICKSIITSLCTHKINNDNILLIYSKILCNYSYLYMINESILNYKFQTLRDQNKLC